MLLTIYSLLCLFLIKKKKLDRPGKDRPGSIIPRLALEDVHNPSKYY